MFIYDLEPGQGSSPYHYEYEEERLLVVEGTVVVRAPDGEHILARGDLVRATDLRRQLQGQDRPRRFLVRRERTRS